MKSLRISDVLVKMGFVLFLMGSAWVLIHLAGTAGS
jgi:hypothetical protein